MIHSNHEQQVFKQLKELRALGQDTATAGLIEAWLGYMKRCRELMFETSWLDDVTLHDKDAALLTQIQRLADEEHWLLERSKSGFEQYTRPGRLQTEPD